MKALTDDNMLHIASFLGSIDLLYLAQTCRRFGSAAAATDTDDVSLVEHAALQLIESAPTHEQNWVSHRKGRTTWVEVYHELLKLRSPLNFKYILGSGIKHINKKNHVYVSLQEQYRQQQVQQAKLLIRRKRSRPISLSSSAVSCVAIGNHIISCRMECTLSNSP